MFKHILLAYLCLCLGLNIGEAITCYHCYDTFNRTLSLGSDFDDPDFGEKYVQCDKSMNNWNTWECPAKWPVCVIMLSKVNTIKKHYEIGRSCAVRDFCSRYKPPIYVQLQSCRECNTSLCNDFPIAHPPGPLFVFNINVNLNIKKNPLTVAGDKDHDNIIHN